MQGDHAESAAVVLMTAEEYAELPDNGQPTELVQGGIVPMNMPFPRHGGLCAQLVFLLKDHLQSHPIGRVISNDSGVITERDPNTVRGADAAFYSFAKVPTGPLPKGYLPTVPEVVFEVHSPTDRWPQFHEKVGEYLTAGVSFVCVLDEQTETAHVYHAEQAPREGRRDEELTLPEVLPDFRVPVRRFFE